MQTALPLLWLALVACGPDEPPCDQAMKISYADADGDGYGLSDSGEETCGIPAGRVAITGDCDDTNPGVYIGAEEICDGIDQDCDDLVDDGLPIQTWYEDVDGDGFGGVALPDLCSQPDGTIDTGGDCDDTNPLILPGGQEICDGVDNDCDGSTDDDDPSTDPTTMTDWHPDNDMDGFGSQFIAVPSCDPPAGSIADGSDCRDDDAAVNPMAQEVCGGGDEDCDGLIDDADSDVDVSGGTTFYLDADGDGLGDPNVPALSCLPGPGYVLNADDCDDSDATATVLQDWLIDDDQDGYGTGSTLGLFCVAPDAYSAPAANGVDCDDTDPSIHPGMAEVLFDGLDNDCNPLTLDVCSVLCEDFEDQDISDWIFTNGGGGVPVIDTQTAAGGTAVSMVMTGGTGGHFHGILQSLPGSPQPTVVSFYIMGDGAVGDRGYMVFGQSPLDFGSVAVFFRLSGGAMTVFDGSLDHFGPYSVGVWHYVEFHLDWQGQTLDWWVDGVQVHNGIPFRDPANSLDELHLYNYSADNAWFDQIMVVQ